jgi:hypothetical protein
MPLGIVSDSEFNAELNNCNTEKQASVKVSDRSGRKPGDLNVPDSLRKIIGEESRINGRRSALELASNFDISSSSVSAYAHGATSTNSYNTPDSGIKQHIAQARERIAKRARSKLNQALYHITPEKLEASKARDLASIAKDMSTIVKDMEPEMGNNELQRPLIIYAPQMLKEEHFETIFLKE